MQHILLLQLHKIYCLHDFGCAEKKKIFCGFKVIRYVEFSIVAKKAIIKTNKTHLHSSVLFKSVEGEDNQFIRQLTFALPITL